MGEEPAPPAGSAAPVVEGAGVAHFCSMKITEGVREYAAKQGLEAERALEAGLHEKAEEFREAGAEIYR